MKEQFYAGGDEELGEFCTVWSMGYLPMFKDKQLCKSTTPTSFYFYFLSVFSLKCIVYSNVDTEKEKKKPASTDITTAMTTQVKGTQFYKTNTRNFKRND